MGVSVQGEACGEVTQHSGHRFDVHTVLQCDGCEGVAEVMEPDFRNASPLQHPLQHIIDAVWGDGTAVGGLGDTTPFVQHRGSVGISCLPALIKNRCDNKQTIHFGEMRSHNPEAQACILPLQR